MNEQFMKWWKGYMPIRTMGETNYLQNAWDAWRAALASSAAAEMPERPLFCGKHDGSIASEHFDKLESIIAGLRAQVADEKLHTKTLEAISEKVNAELEVLLGPAEGRSVLDVVVALKQRAEKAELALSTAEQVGIRKALEVVQEEKPNTELGENSPYPMGLWAMHGDCVSAILALLPKESV